ncbi:MAG: RHS repeat-associated core domain-containing protein, partial [Clostridia bacterium]|nr:RHS repeat-associated core domain-containing protein [Clostridia bacterium]
MSYLDNGIFVDIDENTTYNTNITSLYVALKNPFRYRGYYYDNETKLYYLNSRYYDPEIGRFINIDDIGIIDSTKDCVNGINLYAYCVNNPVNDNDTNGNLSFLLTMLIGGLIGGFISGAFAAGKQIVEHGWDVGKWDWGNIGLAFLGGFVAGAIASAPLPGALLKLGTIGKYLGYVVTFGYGGAGMVAGGLITGSVYDFESGVNAFALGGFANVIAKGIGDTLAFLKAKNIFNQGK